MKEIDRVEKNLLGSRIAGGNTDYNRNESDYYPTPPEATIALMDYLSLPDGSVIWECACGDGHMSETLKALGYGVVSTEFRHTGYGIGGIDFLICDPQPCDWIITNPPFKLAEDFIARCHALGRPFALLLKSQFWHAKRRYKLFQEVKPSAVLPLTWRPDFMFKQRGGGSPLMDCIWCVWDGKSKNTIYLPLEKPNIALPSAERTDIQ